jgi:hypothetical protein
MISVSSISTMLERLGLSEVAATYLTGTCGIDSLDEIAYLDGIEDVDTTIKGFTNPGGTVMTGSGATRVTSRNNVIPVSIRAVASLRLCVYYLKHMERVHLQHIANAIKDPGEYQRVPCLSIWCHWSNIGLYCPPWYFRQTWSWRSCWKLWDCGSRHDGKSATHWMSLCEWQAQGLGHHVQYMWQTILFCLYQTCFTDQEWKGCLYAPFWSFPWPKQCWKHGQWDRDQAH